MATSPRLKYEPVSRYSTKTYLGNWFEETSRYQKQKHHHITTYSQDYVPQASTKLGSDDMWDIYIRGAGLPMHLIFDHGHMYKNNFSTIYDLSYNHFVEKSKIHPLKRNWKCSNNNWVPEVDYAQNYGNATDYGIRKYKTFLWENENPDPRVTDNTKTEYQDSYIRPEDNALRAERWGTPVENSSLMNQNNIDYQVLRYRNRPLFNVTANEQLVVIPRERRCNPITWECPNKMLDTNLGRLSK